MNFYVLMAVDALIVLFLLLLLGVAMSERRYRLAINRQFALFVLAVSIWIPSVHISNSLDTPHNMAVFFDYFVFGASFLASLMLAKIVVELSGRSRFKALFGKIQAPLWIICAMSFTPLVGADVIAQDNVYGVVFGPLTALYFFGLVSIAIIILYVYFSSLRRLSKADKLRFKIIGKSAIISFSLVLLLSLVLPMLTNNFLWTQVGLAPLVIIVFGLYYATARHGLFDIRQAALRTLAYALTLIVLAVVYFVLAFVVVDGLLGLKTEVSWVVNAVNVGLALLLAFIFQPVKYFFDKVTARIFYHNQYKPSDFYESLSRIILTTNELYTLLHRVSALMVETFKAEKVFFILEGQSGRYIAAGNGTFSKIPKQDMVIISEKVNDILQKDELEFDRSLYRLLTSHDVSMVVPLKGGRDRRIGYLFFGDHKSGSYTKRDISVLRSIGGEMIVSIQNALLLQEVRDLNAGLQQRIDAATKELRESNAQLQRLDEAKDEFISMASHQLRTPLTSIKGYISMLIEGDLGEITSQQKRTLEEAFVSSERMVRLVGDFLNVSRLQTGKFVIDKHPVDLARLVAREVEALEQNAKSRNLKFVYKRPKDIPLLDLDENKIQQVVMNFADNAMYYSKEGSKINIILKKTADAIEFAVKDTGIGVPKSEQKGLFNKFFRATNARRQRPDGTGVGLFLAKKVVKDHGGQIIFESEEGKGSTFGFSLPLPKDKKA